MWIVCSFLSGMGLQLLLTRLLHVVDRWFITRESLLRKIKERGTKVLRVLKRLALIPWLLMQLVVFVLAAICVGVWFVIGERHLNEDHLDVY